MDFIDDSASYSQGPDLSLPKYVPMPFEYLTQAGQTLQGRYDTARQNLSNIKDDITNLRYIPESKDEEYVRKVRSSIEDLANNYVDRNLSDPSIYNEIDSKVRSIARDPNLRDIQESYKNWLTHQKEELELNKAGKLHPLLRSNYKGYDTSSQGIYYDSTPEYEQRQLTTQQYFNNIKPDRVQDPSTGQWMEYIDPSRVEEVANNQAKSYAYTQSGRNEIKLARLSGDKRSDEEIAKDILLRDGYEFTNAREGYQRAGRITGFVPSSNQQPSNLYVQPLASEQMSILPKGIASNISEQEQKVSELKTVIDNPLELVPKDAMTGQPLWKPESIKIVTNPNTGQPMLATTPVNTDGTPASQETIKRYTTSLLNNYNEYRISKAELDAVNKQARTELYNKLTPEQKTNVARIEDPSISPRIYNYVRNKAIILAQAPSGEKSQLESLLNRETEEGLANAVNTIKSTYSMPDEDSIRKEMYRIQTGSDDYYNSLTKNREDIFKARTAERLKAGKYTVSTFVDPKVDKDNPTSDAMRYQLDIQRSLLGGTTEDGKYRSPDFSVLRNSEIYDAVTGKKLNNVDYFGGGDKKPKGGWFEPELKRDGIDVTGYFYDPNGGFYWKGTMVVKDKEGLEHKESVYLKTPNIDDLIPRYTGLGDVSETLKVIRAYGLTTPEARQVRSKEIIYGVNDAIINPIKDSNNKISYQLKYTTPQGYNFDEVYDNELDLAKAINEANSSYTSYLSGPKTELSPDINKALDAVEGTSKIPRRYLEKIIRTESTGNPNATSSKGAIGIMQLMPDTAKELGVTNPKDINQNIRGGVTYINRLYDKYNDLELALMAYNWGPGNVDKWIARGKNPNSIPAETRQYIKSILS